MRFLRFALGIPILVLGVTVYLSMAQSIISLPTTLNDGEGFAWDVQGDGRIDDGTSDAFDGGLLLTVDGSSFPGFSSATLASGARELMIGPASLAGVGRGNKADFCA